MKINKYILEIAVFICGAVVMIFELVGSRVLGPYFGTSVFVWTALIGIILGSMSLGYYFGGKISDKNANKESLSMLIFFGALCIIFTFFAKELLMLLYIVSESFYDIKIMSIISCLILFAPASFLLGMVSPYAVRLKMRNIETTGKTVGNLYAISTLGSITGTFLAGFYLIPNFGTNKILIMLSVALIFVSLCLAIKKRTLLKISFLLLSLIAIFLVGAINTIMEKYGKFVDVDTTYNRVWIYDYEHPETNKKIKVMGINNENHSSMFFDSDDLVDEQAKYFRLAEQFNPGFQKTLMFGGAGYSFPKYFLLNYPRATIDVVEIDPKLTELAKKYFRLKDDPRLTIYHQDGRVFLNKNRNKYDVIFADAFASRYSVPYQLTTREAVKKIYDSLEENGLVIFNLISAIEGDKGEFLRAELATYNSIFPKVDIFAVDDLENGQKTQNLILVAFKSGEEPNMESTNPDINKCLQKLWKKPVDEDMPILTDDFAPVDFYINKII
jgi:spermidine synthase